MKYRFVVLRKKDWAEVDDNLQDFGFPPIGDPDREVGVPVGEFEVDVEFGEIPFAPEDDQ